MALKLGKKEATYDSRDLKFTDVRPTGLTLPNLPSTWQHGNDFSNWLMLGNGPCDDGTITSGYAAEGAGDCAWAGPGHETMQGAREANASTKPEFTCLNILNQYAEYLGLNDASEINGNNDEGSNVRDVLKWRQSKGLLDTSGTAHKIGAYVSVELGNWPHIREASYLFEVVGLGINFPSSAMDQFNNGQTWSVVPGAQVEGGHYVPLVGRPSNGLWTCVTWGKAQNLTYSFINKYADEMWAYVSLERYNSVTGETAEGFKDVDLERYISAVGQGALNN